MHCVKKITNDLYWVGANDRRLAMFEGVYSVPKGVSYNSYLLLDDDVTVLFDTVDKAVFEVFFENIEHLLKGRHLDYLVIHHMEPDHSATLAELLLRYPEVQIICSARAEAMIKQFCCRNYDVSIRVVGENDTFKTANHEYTFMMAPMVHWPEVMMSYDSTDKLVFSADAFGAFGALNGAIFADEVDFNHDFMDEARRYYCNIVGKYGTQVQNVLRKMEALDVKLICPLHGFVWRNKLSDFIDKYKKWSSYEPEETGVMIAYASVYGHTENTAEIVSSKLRENGIKTVMFDVSVTPTSEIVAAAFRWSHLLFASTTYNAGIFISMEELLNDIVSHNLQNRTVAFIENGSWAPTSGELMRELVSKCKNMTLISNKVTLLSALRDSQMSDLDKLVEAISESIPGYKKPSPIVTTSGVSPISASTGAVDPNAMFKFSYGLFVLTAKDGKDNGCIINTAAQLTSNPQKINLAVNKANHTHDMILKTGLFNLSVLSENANFDTFKRFGFASGRDTDKFAGYSQFARSANGLAYVTEGTNAFISGKIVDAYDQGTHTLFVAEVTEAVILNNDPSVTYTYYFDHIKPKPQASSGEKKKGWVCKICGYVHDGEDLPADFICPLCKHGIADFERL
ncbi:MAG: flavin reductase [Eubacteriales bacterium]